MLIRSIITLAAITPYLHSRPGNVLWDTKTGRKAFSLSADFVREARVLAAVLLWGLWLGERGVQVCVFFLAYVLVAGVFGAVTASRNILYVRALSTLVALIALLVR